jgi:hypothetical protein
MPTKIAILREAVASMCAPILFRTNELIVLNGNLQHRLNRNEFSAGPADGCASIRFQPAN